jgi:glycosyltransferase involved in cell wall biosynthesis
MPEIFGEAARYYRAGAAEQLAQHVRDAQVLPAEQRQEIRRDARARAGQFTWDLCCQRTVEQLQEAIANHDPDSRENA